MVTLTKYGNCQNMSTSLIVCLSTDTKPTQKIDGIHICNGSALYEMDTKKCYIFDEDNSEWLEV